MARGLVRGTFTYPVFWIFLAAWGTLQGLAVFCRIGAAFELNTAWIGFSLWLIGSCWLSAIVIWLLSHNQKEVRHDDQSKTRPSR